MLGEDMWVFRKGNLWYIEKETKLKTIELPKEAIVDTAVKQENW